MPNQSYSEVFVLSTPTLLASGTTVDLAPGQIGFFDGNTYQATASPTYAKNKAIIIAQGQSDRKVQLMTPNVANGSIKSKLIKGKLVQGATKFTAKRAKGEVVTIGYDGVDVTKTLAAKCGQTKHVYVKLTGAPISKFFTTQGILRDYFIEADGCPECASTDAACANVCAEALADNLVRQINRDLEIRNFVKASKLVHCNPAAAAVSGAVAYKKWLVSVADNGDAQSLGVIAAQYPGKTVKFESRLGFQSTYSITQTSASGTPAAVTNAGILFIPDCPVCPSGYTQANGKFVYLVTRNDNGADASSQLNTDYAVTGTVRINEEAGQGSYIVSKATAISAPFASTDTLTALGQARTACTLTTATTTAWSDSGATLSAYPRVYTLTLLDSCNTNRLAEVQAAFPSLVVTQTASTPGESCAHRYETTVLSDPIDFTCGTGQASYKAPGAFQGISWTPPATVYTACDTCVAGVKIETAWVNRKTDEVSYDYFTHEYDNVHLEVSFYEPDYNAPFASEVIWPVTNLQRIQYEQGSGYSVKEAERLGRAYHQEHHSRDVGVRLGEGYVQYAQLEKYYDEYTLEFEFKYNVGAWSEQYTDLYRIRLFVEEGRGAQLETALNAYLSSINVNLQLVKVG